MVLAGSLGVLIPMDFSANHHFFVEVFYGTKLWSTDTGVRPGVLKNKCIQSPGKIRVTFICIQRQMDQQYIYLDSHINLDWHKNVEYATPQV